MLIERVESAMLVHMLALDSSYVSTGYILSVMLIESAMLALGVSYQSF